MGINSRIAKIPYLALYLILAFLTSFNWIRVILFQKSFEVYKSLQPWDYYLSDQFAKFFSTTQKEYFVFALPVILIILYLIPKLFGKLMNLDKKSNVKGDNHVALLIILFIMPSVLGLNKFFAYGWRGYFIPGIILIILFSVWSWIDEKNFRNTK